MRRVLDCVDLLVLNAIEAEQLETALGVELADLGVADIVVTLGAQGCKWVSERRGDTQNFAAYQADVVDTTGAGDTFTGYVLAGLDAGMVIEDAMALASKAGALMVTRHGTADVIPTIQEVEAFRP